MVAARHDDADDANSTSVFVGDVTTAESMSMRCGYL